MNDNQSYVLLCCLAALVVVFIGACAELDATDKRTTMLEMVKAGADPLRAACSVGITFGPYDACSKLAPVKP